MNTLQRTMLRPQVQKTLYYSDNYIKPHVFARYAYQIREIIALQPRSVLEIGIGNGLVSWILKKVGLEVITLDFDKSLDPDVVASVTDMPLPDSSFDLVACFEVLEHLPFQFFLPALREVWRVSKRYAVLSLPDAKPSVRVRLPKIGRRQFLFETPFHSPKPHSFDGEHYWEINKARYPLKRVLASMARARFAVEKTVRRWECAGQRFFVLGKLTDS